MMRPSPSLAFAAVVAAVLAACSSSPPAPPPTPTAPAVAAPAAPWQSPPTRRADDVDDFFGTKIADPYRWLEDQDSPEVAQWVASQNAATRAVLDAVPQRQAIHDRLRQLWNYARYDAPEQAGSHWFWRKNDGLQSQSVLYVGDDPAGEGRVLLDPNALSPDGTVAVSALAVDEQGEHLAYATSSGGSDWREWHVLDVATGNPLPDTLRWSKFAGVAWTHDGKGFFYQRYPQPEAGHERTAANRNAQYCYHLLGTEQDKDRVVYERPDQPTWGFQGTVTEDGRFLVLHLSEGTDRRNRVTYVDLQQDGWPVQPLCMEFDATYEFVGSDGDTFWFRSNKDAPRGRLIAIDRTQPQPVNWREVVPQRPQTLRGVHLVGDRFLCSYLTDAASNVQMFTRDGKADGELPLPGLGSVGAFTGRAHATATFFSFASFTQPSTIHRFDFATRACVPFRQPAFGRHADDLVTERVFLQSRDGTRLCMFLVHKRGLQLDGKARTYLYGYGGFDIAMAPAFSVANLVWVERGGIYAQAVLRGGGEYGEQWHRAGMLGQKQNVFDDFIACGEYLVRNGYTTSDRLAIGGGSNGGLLVGAALTQRPDLFGAAIPEVGVLDMLRFHRFTIGRAWTPEYGCSENEADFAWLRRYSPLHNVRADVAWPATMVMTGDHDDRVVPGHSFKFAATLQAAQVGPAPILLRVATSAGHGAGKPTGKLIDEAADRWAFLEHTLAR